MAEEKQQFKIVLLGEGCVGKTSLVLRYCETSFNDKHIATLQASHLTKKLNLDGKRVQLEIWDTAGQERFHALGPIYYRDADGALCVYDITDEDSFQKVRNWVRELRAMLGNEIPIIIAGNKMDLEKDRHVKEEDARAYAESVGATYAETSAKLNRGVNEVFLSLTKLMLQRQKQLARSGADLSRQASRAGVRSKGVVLSDDDGTADKQGGKCC